MTENIKVGSWCTSKNNQKDIYLIVENDPNKTYLKTMLVISPDYKNMLFYIFEPTKETFQRVYRMLK